MAIYQRRTTFAEAVQWNDTPESTAECNELLGRDVLDIADSGSSSANALFYCAKSQVRVHIAPGDWIIKEADGSGCYPCAKDVFFDLYDLPEQKRATS